MRTQLYIMFAEMGFKTGAEIGVERGLNALNMFEHIPGLELLMVDTWRGESRRHYKRVMEDMRPYGDKAHIIRKTSLKASLEIQDESLDFVYIDGDHRYDAVMLDIILWSRKVRDGGIVSGHDYRHPRKYRNLGVSRAVNNYVREHEIDLKLGEGRNWYWEKK